MSKVAAGMRCSTYLSVPTLESLAHSGSSSSSSSSRSSFSMFDPGASDSQTDTSPPQSPEKTLQEYGSVSMMALSLKFPPDHVSHFGLDSDPQAVQTTPKDRLFKLRSDCVGNTDDVGYESGREIYISPTRRDRLKVLTKKRGVPARHQGFIQPESSISEDEDACVVVLARDTARATCIPSNFVGSRTIDGTFQLPSSRKEVTGLGLELGPYGLNGATISVDHSLASTSATCRLECPPKPCLVPISDAASPSPIHFLPSPVIMLGLGASQRMPTMPDIWSASYPHQPPPPSNPIVADMQEQKDSLTSTILDLPVNSIEPIIKPLLVASDCMIGQKHPLESTGGSLARLGPSCLPEVQTPDNSTQKIGHISLCMTDLSSSRSLSQAIAFASIPFYAAQPHRKKSATGLGLGRPAGLDQRPQVGYATRSSSSSHILTYATGTGTPRSSMPKVTSPSGPCSPCSPTRRMIVAGAKRLLKPHTFIKRRLYAIPEVVPPTSLSPIVGNFSVTKNIHVEMQDVRRRASTKRRGCTYMNSHLGTTTVTSLSQSGVPSGVVQSGCGSPRSFLSPILIHLEEPQKLNLVKRQSGGNTWNGLRGLF